MRWNNTLWSLVLKCTVGSKGLGLLAVFNFIYKEKAGLSENSHLQTFWQRFILWTITTLDSLGKWVPF